jgi:hypothetical protein
MSRSDNPTWRQRTFITPHSCGLAFITEITEAMLTSSCVTAFVGVSRHLFRLLPSPADSLERPLPCEVVIKS